MIYAEIRPDGKIHQVWYEKGKKFSPPILPNSNLVSFQNNIDVRPGMRWDGQNLLPPEPPPLKQIKVQAKQGIVHFADGVVKKLEVVGIYPQAEREGWPIKLAAAKAYLDGSADAAQTTMIDTEAQLAGVAPNVLAQIIVNKAAWFMKLNAMIAGMRQKAFAAIDAANTHDEVRQVLAQMQAEAEQALQQLLAEKP